MVTVEHTCTIVRGSADSALKLYVHGKVLLVKSP